MTTIDFEAEAAKEAAAAPDDSAMRAVADLCHDAAAAEAEVAELEQRLKEAKERHRELTERMIPDAMLDCGLSSVTLADGRGVVIKYIISATPKEADRPWVFDWLRENGHADLIKNEVTASFGAGDDELAEAALHYLEEQHFATSRKQSVHWQTLNAFVREQLREGNQLPEDKFGIYIGKKAEIK